MKIPFFLIVSIFFLFSCGQNAGDRQENDLYDEADKGFTTDDLEDDFEEMVPVDITITASNLSFEPNTIEATAGELVRIILKNEGDSPHNVAFELTSGVVKFTQNVEVGATDSMEFTVPVEVNTYEMYCPVDDHRQQGMTGELIINVPDEEDI